MDQLDYVQIGQRIRLLRKKKHLNQTELAQRLGKALRTVQKYETGEIEVSIAMINQLAEVLDSTPTYILGYETRNTGIRNMADIMDFLFKLEQVNGLQFHIDVKRPPRNGSWECSIAFDGKANAPHNADICLFLEDWEEQRDDVRTYAHTQSQYAKWKEQTLAYYAATPVSSTQPEELDEETRIKLRNEYLEKSIKGEV